MMRKSSRGNPLHYPAGSPRGGNSHRKDLMVRLRAERKPMMNMKRKRKNAKGLKNPRHETHWMNGSMYMNRMGNTITLDRNSIF